MDTRNACACDGIFPDSPKRDSAVRIDPPPFQHRRGVAGLWLGEVVEWRREGLLAPLVRKVYFTSKTSSLPVRHFEDEPDIPAQAARRPASDSPSVGYCCGI